MSKRIQENPFDQRSAALRAGSSAPSTPSGSEALARLTVAPGGLFSADTVQAQIEALASLPEYIRKLEKRERAAQKSVEAKAKRIISLEEQAQRCVFPCAEWSFRPLLIQDVYYHLRQASEIRALKETLAALRARQ